MRWTGGRDYESEGQRFDSSRAHQLLASLGGGARRTPSGPAGFASEERPTGSARAATIDTTGSDTGTIVQFGAPDTATYGQTFTAPGSLLDSFSLFLRNRFTGTASLDLRGYVAGWNGLMASSILYESSTRTMNAGGALQQFDFSPSQPLTPGRQYVVFLSIANLPVGRHGRSP